jgi:hypothetical protein
MRLALHNNILYEHITNNHTYYLIKAFSNKAFLKRKRDQIHPLPRKFKLPFPSQAHPLHRDSFV